MRTHVKAYAKINLSLNILGVKNGYHELDSIVTTIDIYDDIVIKKRKDDKINLTMRGLGEGLIDDVDNNAYKAAKLFKETFSTSGMDITITKRIPLSGGLGGSSADIAGVLKALKIQFDIAEDVKPLADRLGSDSGYLLSGGFARISGRGEYVEKIDAQTDFWVVLIYEESGVNTAECFSRYDEMEKVYKRSDNDELVKAIEEGDIIKISKQVANDLANPACDLNEKVAKNLKALEDLTPLCSSVSGSGSTTFAIFENKEFALWAVDRLKKQGYDAEAVQTIHKIK